MSSLVVLLFAPPVCPAVEKEFGTEHSAGARRGIVALPNEQGTITVGWRLLADDPEDVGFHVYRRDIYAEREFRRLTSTPLTQSTTWVDDEIKLGNSYRYQIRAVVAGQEQPPTPKETAYVTAIDSHRPYVSIKFEEEYQACTVGLGDVDGDGVLDFVIKQPNFNVDPYHREGYWKRSPEPFKLEAWNGVTGRMMWRYDMGWAIETGVWYSPYIVYDIDRDGRAEVYAKAGEGDPRALDGRVLEGPEFVAKIDGLTGEIVRKARWHTREGWLSYNRSMRNMLAVAYLDGETPALIMQRGTYDIIKTRALDQHLRPIWDQMLTNPEGAPPGPGTHGLISADIDRDGRDELVIGATALDDDGQILWETGLGHPDVCHVADIDPTRTGLEVFFGIEPPRSSHGVCLAAAESGEILWHYDGSTKHVHSKGMIGDITPTSPGMECYGEEKDRSQAWLYAADGKRMSEKSFGTLAPRAVWWDADPQKEMIVDGRLFNYPDDTIMEIEGRVLAIVDCLGDWREEIITSSPGELRIYSPTQAIETRRVWLMEDRQYRLGVAAGSMGYYREPQLSVPLFE